MTKTMGEILRELRLSRNLSQEQLGEYLNVTPQAISKWENNIGLPDISQVVPIARFFEISTDVLFGLGSNHTVDEVKTYIERATAMESLRDEYLLLKKALKRYPGDVRLLSELLSCGECLLANDALLPETERDDIFYECERAGKLILSYSQNLNMRMDTLEWLIKLYCETNNTEEALALCESLPCRIGFYRDTALARVWETEEKNLDAASLYESSFAQYQREAMRSLLLAGNLYAKEGQAKKAISFYTAAMAIGEAVMAHNPIPEHKSLIQNLSANQERCRKSIAKLV